MPSTLPGLTPRADVLRAYWNLACERQKVFFARLNNKQPPWTQDSIISAYKFCNAYRASDRVSQYLIRDVIYEHDLPSQDVLLRTILFRLFSKPATWEAVEERIGPITTRNFPVATIDRILEDRRASGQRIYTSAFILCANNAYGHARKHQNHLALIEHMFKSRGGLPPVVARAQGLEDLYLALREYPLIGPFMAYQLAVDINYSEVVDFSEDEFTVAGPGAQRGIRKCFAATNGHSTREIIDWMTATQEEQFERFELSFSNLWGRRLAAIDCQGLFCETDKYSRVAFPQLVSNRTQIKARFAPTSDPISYFYPPKWGLNQRIAVEQPESTS
jgi:hypothetical protein